MPDDNARPLRVLFLCTGNSARSVIAEACLNAVGGGRFLASSAGSRPAGRVHPGALQVLARHGINAGGARSKSWDEFVGGDPVDIVITVCDAAAGETCPVFPGRGVRAHWPVPDPPAAGDEAAVTQAFEHALRVLSARIGDLVGLPTEVLRGPDAGARLAAIAGRHPAT